MMFPQQLSTRPGICRAGYLQLNYASPLVAAPPSPVLPLPLELPPSLMLRLLALAVLAAPLVQACGRENAEARDQHAPQPTHRRRWCRSHYRGTRGASRGRGSCSSCPSVCVWGGRVFEGVCGCVTPWRFGVSSGQRREEWVRLSARPAIAQGDWWRSGRSRRGWPGAETGGGRDVGWSTRDLVLEGLLRADHQSHSRTLKVRPVGQGMIVRTMRAHPQMYEPCEGQGPPRIPSTGARGLSDGEWHCFSISGKVAKARHTGMHTILA